MTINAKNIMKINARFKKIYLACLDNYIAGYTHLRSASPRITAFGKLNIGVISPCSLVCHGGTIDYHVTDIHVLKTKPMCKV